MKKQLALLALATLTAVTASAQGTVNFSTRVSGIVVAHVYGFSPLDPDQLYGNTAQEFPPGTQTYGGAILQGSGYSATLWAANGANASLNELMFVPGSLTTMRTGGTLGGTPAPLALAVPGIPAGGTGTFQIRVWDNMGGTITSWSEAVAFSKTGSSQLFTVSNLGDGVLTLPADMANVRSFNLYVPEPGTYALLGLGGLAVTLIRRRKN